MRVLVCGGRAYSDRARVREVLDGLHVQGGISAVIEGGQTGADTLAREWAVEHGITPEMFTPDWSIGRAAGPIRNRRMLSEGRPDLVVAFPGGDGTEDMCEAAYAKGIEVVLIEDALPFDDPFEPAEFTAAARMHP